MRDGDSQLPRAAHVLQLRVALLNFEPVVWRRVLVPETITLPKLHLVLQDLMLWQNRHLHTFELDADRYGEPDFADDFDDDLRDERRVKVVPLLRTGVPLIYNYDFGDCWHLCLELEETTAVRAPLRYPVCIAGDFAAPPEDVGGVEGFRRFVEAMSSPTHVLHEMLSDWHGEEYLFTRVALAEINTRLQQRSASSLS